MNQTVPGSLVDASPWLARWPELRLLFRSTPVIAGEAEAAYRALLRACFKSGIGSRRFASRMPPILPGRCAAMSRRAGTSLPRPRRGCQEADAPEARMAPTLRVSD